MCQKLYIDSLFSFLLFTLVNAAGVYLVVSDNSLFGIEYPIVLIICYTFLYINSAIAFFGYRVREIGSILELSNLSGKEVDLNVGDISSLRSILIYIYILKSKRRVYLIWSTLSKAEREKFENFSTGA